jgi:hypothetical protein
MARVPESAIKMVENLNLQDLKRSCIIRGIPFEDVCDKSVLGLQSWYLSHYDYPVNHSLLEAYDIWSEALLRERGVDPTMISPYFRLSAIGIRNANGEVVKRKRVKSLTPKFKRKKARTQEGLFQGTKKALTYALCKEGLAKEEVIAKVIEQFPDAKPKSIGIWYNRSKKSKK